MPCTRFAAVASATLLLVLLALTSCGDDGGAGGSASRTATPGGTPTASPDPLVPPLEGPPRDAYIGERQDFRTNPDYQLPNPNGVPTPPADDDPLLNPPSTPECPEDWETLFRGPEGFQLCYPPEWTVLTDAYKNAPNEERWYAGGVFNFATERQDRQLAHVSIYVIPQYTRPFPYTKDCPTPYSVRLNNQPAVVCPSFPASHPEARIVSYHVFRENLDYFFNIAQYYEWDEEKGEYTDETDEEAFETALKIIQTVEFLEVPTPEPAATTSGQ